MVFIISKNFTILMSRTRPNRESGDRYFLNSFYGGEIADRFFEIEQNSFLGFDRSHLKKNEKNHTTEVYSHVNSV